MVVLIDLVDVLWFVPTLWAPLIIADGLAHARARTAEAEPVAETPIVWGSPSTVH